MPRAGSSVGGLAGGGSRMVRRKRASKRVAGVAVCGSWRGSSRPRRRRGGFVGDLGSVVGDADTNVASGAL